ncbi:MAG: TadE/TadG family type IV pilus assembly protein [Candidatus Limnocylindria bacterium]
MSRIAERQPRSLRARRARGQALVEFALVAPIFFLLLIGLVEGGRYVFYSDMLNHATREGARYGIVHGSNSTDPTGPGSGDPTGEDVRNAVVDAAPGLASSPGDFDALEPCWRTGTLAPSDPCPNTNNHRGTTIDVRAEYTYMPIVPLFGPITIRGESSLVINN